MLREIDRRVRYLTKRIEDLRVVEYSPEQEGKVYFGARVTIEDEEGNELVFRIVGPDEIYDVKGVISIDSPMARALLSKQVDDEVEVRTPTGSQLWYVGAIAYE